jgi:predicted acyltransferase
VLYTIVAVFCWLLFAAAAAVGQAVNKVNVLNKHMFTVEPALARTWLSGYVMGSCCQ